MAVSFRDNDGTTRLAGDLLAAGGATGDVLTQQADGTYAPAAGGSQPVTCLLEVFPLDVHDAGSHPCLWNALFDNPKDFGTLLAIPAGLGLTFDFDGTDATITTTEAGTWAFSIGANIGVQDATWAGVLLLDTNLYMGSQVAGADFGSLRNAAVCEVLTVTTGYSFAPKIDTRVIATNDPLNADVYLSVVRLA